MIDYVRASEKGFKIEGVRRLPLARRPEATTHWITWLESATIGCLHMRVRFGPILDLGYDLGSRIEAQADLCATWTVEPTGVITCMAAWAIGQSVEPLARLLVSDFVRESIEALWAANDGQSQAEGIP